MKHDRKQEAFDLVEQAASRLPDSAELLLDKVIVLQRMSRSAEADQLLRQLQSKWPEWDRVYFVRALLLATRSKLSEAEQAGRLAISLGADAVEVFAGLARATESSSPEESSKYRTEATKLLASRAGPPEKPSRIVEALFPPKRR